jgi:hypothetical protein
MHEPQAPEGSPTGAPEPAHGPAGVSDPPAAPSAEPTARWEDYVDIFIAPASVFRRRAEDSPGPPLAVLLVLSALLYLTLIPANRLIMEAGAAAADPAAAAFMEDWGTILQLLGAIFVPITTLAMVAAAALAIWIVTRLAGVPLAASRAFLIAVYAGFVLLVGQVAAAALVLLHSGGPIDVHRDLSLGVLRVLPAGEIPTTTVALLRRVDLFAIWQAALWGVGVRWVGRTTAGRAAIVAIVVWMLAALPGLLMALFGPTSPAMPGH